MVLLFSSFPESFFLFLSLSPRQKGEAWSEAKVQTIRQVTVLPVSLSGQLDKTTYVITPEHCMWAVAQRVVASSARSTMHLPCTNHQSDQKPARIQLQAVVENRNPNV